MAPLWQAWPIHGTADVYATSRHGAARDFRCSRQDKSRKVRSVSTPAISIVLQTLRVSGATCRSWQCAAVAKLSTLRGVKMTSNDHFRVDPGCSSRPWRGCSRAQQAMIAWQQKAGSSAAGQGRKPAEPVARSASLDRLTPGRQPHPSDHGLPSTELVLQRDKVRRLALGALVLIASFQKSQRDHLVCRPCAVSKTNVQTNTCDRREPANAGSLYLAIKRSTSCVSSLMRRSSTNCDATKTAKSITRADSVRTWCSGCDRSLAKARAPKGPMPPPGAAAAAPVVWYSGAGRRGQTCPDRMRECPVSWIADGKQISQKRRD